jgi:hypothetical protein
MPRRRVETSRARTDGEAACEGCRFRMECTRERARQHAADHGHVVHFVIRDITTYYPPENHSG